MPYIKVLSAMKERNKIDPVYFAKYEKNLNIVKL